MSRRLLIGFHGPMYSGKDTAAAGIIRSRPWAKRAAFADELKRIAMLVWGLTWEQVYGSEKDTPFAAGPVDLDLLMYRVEEETSLCLPRWGKRAESPREVIQWMPTEYVRYVDPYYWIRFLMGQISTWQFPVISDVRSDDEAQAIRSAGGVVVEVQRAVEFRRTTSKHSTERRIDPGLIDYVADNNGPIWMLDQQVEEIVQEVEREVEQAQLLGDRSE